LPELRAREVCVRFGGIQALTDVDLEVREGTVAGLIGPNGAGKTTMFDVMSGLRAPTSGRVELKGRDITRLPPHRRARLGIARTFQRLEVCGSLSVRENVQMATEVMRSKLPQGTRPRDRAIELVELVGLEHVAEEPADAIPTGQARLVEVARALAISPTFLLVDEPSAGLDATETASLGRVFRRLAGNGLGILLVEHDMSLVMEVCQDLTVLDAGTVVARGEPEAVRNDPAVQAAYLGSPGTSENKDPSPPPPGPLAGRTTTEATSQSVVRAGAEELAIPGPSPSPPPTPVIELEDVRAGYGRIEVIHGVSFRVDAGSALALLGPNGAGKSTLLKVLSGRLVPASGTVRLDGEPVGRAHPDALARRGVCTVPEGRPVFANLTVAEHFRMCSYRGRGIKSSELEERTYQRFPRLAERRTQFAGRLSGGEQQMLALARALFTEPRVLLLDEISMGLAPIVVSQLYELVEELIHQDELTVVVVEQFADMALKLATDAAVMVNGVLTRRGTPGEVAEYLVSDYLGSNPFPPARTVAT
jgi:branched-chain amino acid transport system ATP-binding protein